MNVEMPYYKVRMAFDNPVDVNEAQDETFRTAGKVLVNPYQVIVNAN